jgi:sucrose-6-phosphate hydrolase SacC (GH32 family)
MIPKSVDWIQLPVALDLNAWYDSGGDFSGSATVLDDEDKTV